jgi:hypothetical protein
MTVNVNPPPQLRIPDKFFNDPEIRSFYEQQQRIIFQLWIRTGGSSDSVASTEEELTSTGSRVARNAARLNAIEKVDFDIEIITADFTTSRNQIIICQNTTSIDVTLDPNAIAEDEVHIKRTDAVIDVFGSIDGKTQKRINIRYYSMHLVFDGTSWNEI